MGNYADIEAVGLGEARRAHALNELMKVSGVGFGPTSVEELIKNAADIERYLKDGYPGE